MGWVLDSSVALAWALPDETTPSTLDFLDRLRPGDSFWAPALWWTEVANGLTMAWRRRRISESDCMRLLENCGRLPVFIDRETGPAFARLLAALAGLHAVTVYDAAYIELAQRKGLPLATLDAGLRSAAVSCGVHVL